MKARCEYCELQVAFGHAGAGQCIDQAGAANFMADVSRPLLPGVVPLPTSCSKAASRTLGSLLSSQARSSDSRLYATGVDFRMVFFRLRHSKQPVEFR